MIDMHAHVLPAIDDGPRDWAAVLAMLEIARDDGIRTICATPHFLEGRYRSTAATIRLLVEEARQRAAEAGIGIEVQPGHEVYATAGIDRLVRADEVMTVGDRGRHVLVEFPYTEVPRWWRNLDADLRGAGLGAILAHPERNAGALADPRRLLPLLERGWRFQIDAQSLLGVWGESVKCLAEGMIRWRWIHLVGSDAHEPRTRVPRLTACRARVAEIAGEEAAESIFARWPAQILAGEEIVAPPPAAPRSEGPWERWWRRMRDSLAGRRRR